MFLQLFVAQLQYQDPLNPADGTQFVSQLAQLSELEQMTSMNQSVGTIQTDLSSLLPTASSSSAAGSSAAGTSAPAAGQTSAGTTTDGTTPASGTQNQ
jgi:flagellar basal-body rod modification protein FlgD